MDKQIEFECKCIKCKHIWIKRSSSIPKQCPKCKQYAWAEDIAEVEW